MNRREMRKSAFILVFEKIFAEDSAEEIINTAEETEFFEVTDGCRELFIKTVDNCEAIDTYINANLVGWNIGRISKVSLAILRLAVCEMFFAKETPVAVIINEAVELAKEFSTEQDASFINGVLGSIARKSGENSDINENTAQISEKLPEEAKEI